MKKINEKLLEQLKSRISKPIVKEQKEIIFLAGAGINFNISENGKDWNTFIIESIAKKLKTGNQYKKALVANDLYMNNDYKLVLMPKLDEQLEFITRNDVLWFENTFRKISNKSIVSVITTNYDKTISDLLRIKSYDSLKDEKIHMGKISHIHGMYDKTKSNKLVLTMKDYIDETDGVSRTLKNYFKTDMVEERTVVIIGMSMNELHISKELSEFIEFNSANKIYFITRFDGDKEANEYVRERFERTFKAKVINIKSGNNYSDDFKNFWIKLGDIKDEQILISDLDSMSVKNIDHQSIMWDATKSIEENIDKVIFKDDDEKASFVISSYYYTNNFNSKDYNEFISKLKLKNLWKYFKSRNKTEISEVNSRKIIQGLPTEDSWNDSYTYFMEKIFKNDQLLLYAMEFEEWRGWIYKSLLLDKKNTNINFEIINNKIKREGIPELDSFWNLDYYPYKNTKFYKVFNKNKYEKSIDEIIGAKEKRFARNLKVMRLINTNPKKQDIPKYIENMNKSPDIPSKYLYLVDLCLLYIKSKYENEFISEIRGLKEFPFDYWPSSIDYIGHEGSFAENFSELDKKPIHPNTFKYNDIKTLVKNAKIEDKNNKYISKKTMDNLINLLDEATIEEYLDDIVEFMNIDSFRNSNWRMFRNAPKIKPKTWKLYGKLIDSKINQLISLEFPENIDEKLDQAISSDNEIKGWKYIKYKMEYGHISYYDLIISSDLLNFIFKWKNNKEFKNLLDQMGLSDDPKILEEKILETSEGMKILSIVSIVDKIYADFNYSDKTKKYFKGILLKRDDQLFGITYISNKIFGETTIKNLLEVRNSEEFNPSQNAEIVDILIDSSIRLNKNISFKISEIFHFIRRFTSIQGIKSKISKMIINSEKEEVDNSIDHFLESMPVSSTNFTKKAIEKIINEVEFIITSKNNISDYNGIINPYFISNISNFMDSVNHKDLEDKKENVNKLLSLNYGWKTYIDARDIYDKN